MQQSPLYSVRTIRQHRTKTAFGFVQCSLDQLSHHAEKADINIRSVEKWRKYYG